MAGIDALGNPNLPGTTANLLGINSAPAPTPTPTAVGVQAKAPTNNITPPTNTIPAAQTNLKDLSQYYANVNGTIYNKTRGATGGFSSWDQFLQDAGLPPGTSGTTLKFDTTWTPPTATPTTSTTTPTPSTSQNPTSNSPSVTPPPNTSAPNTPYTPPNGGTTGVSQGGLIGNLVGLATTQNPNYTAAQAKVTDLGSQLSDLENQAAVDTNNIDSRPEGLTEQSGQEGLLARLLASREAALSPAYNAAVAELGAANTQQGQNIQATSSAASANAPITNPQTQGLVSPSTNTTTGQTTSGAANLSSLIGVGNGSNGHPQGEYFVNSAVGGMQANQGFSSPQQLADFVNQQQPGANVTAANVFQYLQNQGSSGTDVNSILSGMGITGSSAQYFTGLIQAVQNSNGDMNAAGVPATIQPIMTEILQKMSGGTYSPGNAAINQSNSAAAAANANQVVPIAKTAISNLSVLQKLSDQVNYSNSPLTNSVRNLFSNSFLTDPSITNLQSALSYVTGEVSQVLGGGDSTVAALNNAAAGLQAGTLSPQNLQGIIKTATQLVQNRLNELSNPANAVSLPTGLNTPNAGNINLSSPTSSASIPPGTLTVP